MEDDRAQVEMLIVDFFATFDNRSGRIPREVELTRLFAEKAVVAKHNVDNCEMSSPTEFAAPRVALLRSGALVDFHE